MNENYSNVTKTIKTVTKDTFISLRMSKTDLENFQILVKSKTVTNA